MNRKNIIIGILLLLFIGITEEAYSQRKASRSTRSTRTSDRQEEKVSFNDKMNYEIGLGGIGIGSGFSISLKGGAGYKLIDQISVGGGGKMLYIFDNRPGLGNDQSFFDYGGLLYTRFKITDNIYIQGEYDFMSFDTGANADRVNINFPLFGLGYMSGYGPWKYGIQLLFVGDELARTYMATTIDYWILFSYNF